MFSVNVDLQGIEPQIDMYKISVLPLNYRSMVLENGIEPLFILHQSIVLPLDDSSWIIGGELHPCNKCFADICVSTSPPIHVNDVFF